VTSAAGMKVVALNFRPMRLHVFYCLTPGKTCETCCSKQRALAEYIKIPAGIVETTARMPVT